jgi:gamma-glutamyltranspeptidase/glutathione hydrolase
MMCFRFRSLICNPVLFAAVLFVASLGPINAQARDDVVRCRSGAVVSVSEPASQIGLQALERGGTAVDAAVATAFALAVTYPAAGNIGGGGYMLVAPGEAGAAGMVFDFRETAPAAATEEMFVDPAARFGHRRVGVPGTVRGLAMAHARGGRLPWRDLVMPAVTLAREGFALDAAVASQLNRVLARSPRKQFESLHVAFARDDQNPWRPGDRLVQRELADVLERIADAGADGFYTGRTAELISQEMQRGGGIITAADLEAYQAVERKPLVGSYRGHEILAVPPSSSGGTTLVLALNLLETFDLAAEPRWSGATLHRMVESMRRAYCERARYLGDPAFNQIPDKLLDKVFARQMAATIDPKRATPSEALAGDMAIASEGDHTTHLSVIDSAGTAVSLTYTLESAFGSRVVVSGGGFLLNDEMNDFNWLPGVTNRAGRIGTPANRVAPGKRMLSSMCPTIVRREGRTLLVTGSPGGRTIINTVLQVVVNVVDYDLGPREAVDAPRLHHQWLPDRVRVEPLFAQRQAESIAALRILGHDVTVAVEDQGDAHTIWIDPATREIVAVPDRRTSGAAAGY